MNENQRIKTVKRVKTIGCITLAALIGLGAGFLIGRDLPKIRNEAKVASTRIVVGDTLDRDRKNYGQALETYNELIKSMINASEKTKVNLFEFKEKIQGVNPFKLMKEADSITAKEPLDFLVDNYKDKMYPQNIHGIGAKLKKVLNLYYLTGDGFRSLGGSTDFLESKIVSTYLNLLLTETIKSNEIFDEKNSQSTHARNHLYYPNTLDNFRWDAPSYQRKLLSYLKGRKITNNLGIKEENLSAFLDASVLLVNNVLSKFPEHEEDISKWLKYLELTDDIGRLLGISEQYRKEKLDPMKEKIDPTKKLILTYCQ